MLNIIKATIALSVFSLGALLGTTANAADYVPKKFQGTWVCNGASSMTIGADTVSFGEKLKLLSIAPGDEAFNTVIVKWLPNPGALTVVKYWKLIKFNGKQFLCINADSPASSSLCLSK